MIKDEEAFLEFAMRFTLSTKCNWPDFYIRTLLTMIRCMFIYDRKTRMSQDTYYFLEKILSDQDSQQKEEVIKILSTAEMFNLKFMMTNYILDYYISLEKDDSRYKIRNTIHSILEKSSAFSVINICKRTIRFINFMLGDFEYFLSMGLTGISDIKIHKKKVQELEKKIAEVDEKLKDYGVPQQQSDNPNALITSFFYKVGLNSKAEVLKKEREDLTEALKYTTSALRRSESEAKSVFIFIKGCFSIFRQITKYCPELLLQDELIKSFVSVLNYNLAIITGPRCSDLKIENPESYNFNPKELLRGMVLIYISIKKNKFVNAVANEEMYFDIEIFRTALSICESKYLINESQIRDFMELISRLESVEVTIDFDDIPEEFMDPLTLKPMKNPVKLLTSKVTIDRSTYDLIMLNDEIDPFTRLPLTPDVVMEDMELKEKIDNFYKSKKSKS